MLLLSKDKTAEEYRCGLKQQVNLYLRDTGSNCIK